MLSKEADVMDTEEASGATGPATETAAEPAPVWTNTCRDHPTVSANQRCSICRAWICRTCAFQFPNRVTACPTCATRETETFTPARRNYMIGSYVCAGVVMVAWTAFFWRIATFVGGVDAERSLEALGILMFLVTMAGGITGMALARVAKPPGGKMPAVLLVPWFWNMALLFGLLILVVVGNME